MLSFRFLYDATVKKNYFYFSLDTFTCYNIILTTLPKYLFWLKKKKLCILRYINYL